MSKNEVVRIIESEDGESFGADLWHLVVRQDASPRTLCSGEVFGYGEGVAKYQSKLVLRGGITCEDCLRIIKQFKSIRL